MAHINREIGLILVQITLFFYSKTLISSALKIKFI